MVRVTIHYVAAIASTLAAAPAPGLSLAVIPGKGRPGTRRGKIVDGCARHGGTSHPLPCDSSRRCALLAVISGGRTWSRPRSGRAPGRAGLGWAGRYGNVPRADAGLSPAARKLNLSLPDGLVEGPGV